MCEDRKTHAVKAHNDFPARLPRLPHLRSACKPFAVRGNVPLVMRLQARAQIWGRPQGRGKAAAARVGAPPKDQNGDPVTNSRVRVKLPDGSTKEGATNSEGELEIAGFTQDGPADITLLDHAKPGKAEAPEWPEEKEFKVTVVDEIGNPLSGIWLYFRHGSASNLVVTDDSGVACYKTSNADTVSVTFESPDALAQVMKPIWTECRGKARKDWVQQDDSTTNVTLFGGNIVKAIADDATTGTTRPKETLEPFFGIQVAPDDGSSSPVRLSVQPLVIMVRMLGELFDIDKCFLLPKGLDSVQQLVKLHKEYQLMNVLITGHTDTSASDAYNLDLSLQRTNAMMAYLFNDSKSWYAWYGEDKKQSKRWGTTEDHYMIATLLTGSPSKPKDTDSANASDAQGSADGTGDQTASGDDATSAYPQTVLGYQQWHNANQTQLTAQAPNPSYYETLDEDSKAGEQTRMQLIYDYMNREDTTVPDGTPVQVHGCGEFFPLSASGEKVDQSTPDGQHIQKDRRVEVFLFPSELGVLPPVPGETASGRGEKEYPEWRYRSVELRVGAPDNKDIARVRLHDAVGNPLPSVVYQVTTPGYETDECTTDDDGWAYVHIGATCPSTPIDIQWDKLDNGEFIYKQSVLLDCGAGATNDAGKLRLKNLAYDITNLDKAVDQFQLSYGLTRTAPTNDQMDSDTLGKLQEIFETNNCNATRKKQETA